MSIWNKLSKEHKSGLGSLPDYKPGGPGGASVGVGPATITAATGGTFQGLIIDSAGRLITVDPTNSGYRILNPDGATTDNQPTGTGPNGIVADSQGYVYTANGTGASVSKYKPGSGVASQTAWATLSGYATSLVIDAAGNLFVYINGGAGASWIDKVTPAGVVTSKWAQGVSDRASVLLMDSAGNIYAIPKVTSTTMSKVTPAGVVTAAYKSYTNEQHTGAISSDGIIYTASTTAKTVSRLLPSGVLNDPWYTFTATGAYNLGIMSLDGAGNIYVPMMDKTTVCKITPAGIANESWKAVPGGNWPMTVAMDANGDCFAVTQNALFVRLGQ